MFETVITLYDNIGTFRPDDFLRYGPFRSCARDLVIARLTMQHGTVLGDANKKTVLLQDSSAMHCQRRYFQTPSATSEWRIAKIAFVGRHRTHITNDHILHKVYA